MKIEIRRGKVLCGEREIVVLDEHAVIKYIEEEGYAVHPRSRDYVAYLPSFEERNRICSAIEKRFSSGTLYEKYRKMKYNELVHLAHERGLNPYRKKKEELIRLLVESER